MKLIVIACGTATSQALEEVKNLYPVPIIGIIDSTVEYLEEKYRNNKNAEIGIIATAGTIKSNGWQNKIKELIPSAKIKAKGCPLLAPMAEEGWIDNQIARLTIKEYLKEMRKIDTLILGCTHYKLIESLIPNDTLHLRLPNASVEKTILRAFEIHSCKHLLYRRLSSSAQRLTSKDYRRRLP